MDVDKAARRRWVVLVGALLLTVAAMFFCPQDDAVVEARPNRPTPANSIAAVPAPPTGAPVFEEEGDANPFERRGWIEPPVVAPPVAESIPVLAAAIVQVAPEGPPPLPFKYVGRFSDDGAGVVYVSRGDAALVARVGDTLEGGYRVTAMDARQVDFEHISSGTRQSLQIPDAE